MTTTTKHKNQSALVETTTTTTGRQLNFNDSSMASSINAHNKSAASGNQATVKEAANQNQRATDAQVMMHILKANIGTGVLAMPNAFRNVGLWTGFVLVPIIGGICIHCMNILIQSHNRLCDRFNYESLDYDQVAALGLACGPKMFRRMAKKAHIIVTAFLIVTQVGFCCVYTMFVVENLQLACLNLFGLNYSTTTYLFAIFPIIGLTSCTSNLNHLAKISTLANILQSAGLGLIFYDLLQFHTFSSSSKSNSNSTSTLEDSIQVNPVISDDLAGGLPLFFATAVYAFEGIGVVLPLVKEMKYPAHISGLSGVLNTAMSLVALLYMGVGFFGYAKYGQYVQGSITLNLPETTLNELVRFIFALAIGLSYSLQFYVPWTIIWPEIDEALFYSYRPRPQRDKLVILDKLTAENEWILESSDEEEEEEEEGADDEQEKQTDRYLSTDDNSIASTFATSYTMSTYQTTTSGKALRHSSKQVAALNETSGVTSQSRGECINHYGSILTADGHSTQVGEQISVVVSNNSNSNSNSLTTTSRDKQSASWAAKRRRRNRLEDVEEDVEDEDSMPEVHWRPPPISMRGKRKVVRYSVILLAVSFTFVAAALVPRLDLFISLIGALASSCLGIIFPAIIQLCTFWSQNPEEDDGHTFEGWSWSLFVAKNLLLVVFGLLGLITGGYVSISQLSDSYLGLNE